MNQILPNLAILEEYMIMLLNKVQDKPLVQILHNDNALIITDDCKTNL